MSLEAVVCGLDKLDKSVKFFKSSQVSAHTLPPQLASGTHSIGFRMVVCDQI